ncbi:hypothetical protein [Qipengyuania sp. MTN3-11]|uniref:hypothetical protein n=1 Tax=Qipengyuania sp. MTN3-11 TaxID=3056557 RepID=UPI0036F19AF0
MSEPSPIELPEVVRLALASARPRDRPIFEIAFALDARLARIVGATSEPMLGQLRLSWWRDQLSGDGAIDRRGEPLLERIDSSWSGSRAALIALVDGWEACLLAEQNGWRHAAQGRSAVFAAIAERIGSSSSEDYVAAATGAWTAAQIGASEPFRIRQSQGDGSIALSDPAPLDKAMRPLAVLAGLGRRALRHGHSDLMAGRTMPFVAMRLGLFGR